MKEEQILFPYVVRMEESVLAGEPAPPAMFGTVMNPIGMMMQEHDGAGDALRSLRSANQRLHASRQTPASAIARCIEALQGFEADLHQHIHLENNILFPRAAAMEEQSSLGLSRLSRPSDEHNCNSDFIRRRFIMQYKKLWIALGWSC